MLVLRALVTVFALCSSICAFAQGASSIWDHNGSAVYLSADGAGRRFYYQAPRGGLQEVGVQPGTLLFDGRRDENRYSGTAYVFSKFCGALAYAVSGPVSPDQRSVTMYGKAPTLDSNCRVVGYRDDVLVFTFSSSSEIAKAQSPEDAVTEAFAMANVEEEKRQSELRIIQQQELERQRVEASRQRIAEADRARQQAEAEAREAQQRALQAKQSTPTAEPSATAAAASEIGFGQLFLADHFRALQVFASVAYAAGVIVLGLFLCVLASIISTTSVDVLKRRAAIFAWIALPSLPTGVVLLFVPEAGIAKTYVPSILFLWTDVFAALAIGVSLRCLLSSTSKPPSVLSLPLATLVFTSIFYVVGRLFIEYGTFPNTLTCKPPYSPLSGCGYFNYEGFFGAAAGLILLILFGAALPANSNLIRGYDSINARIFGRRRQAEPAGLEPPEAQSTTRSNTNESKHEWDKSAIKSALKNKRQEFDL
jgi:hypothetical protein